MNTATKMLTFLITTALSSAVYAEDTMTKHNKALSTYNETPLIQLESTTEFNDKDLQRFADVQEQLSTVRQNFSTRIDDAPNVPTKDSLQRQSDQQVVKAIRENGFHLDDYMQMATAVESNPAIRADVQSRTTMKLPKDTMYGTRNHVLENHGDAPVADKVRAEFTEDELRSYAEVQDDLMQIRDKYSDKIEQSDSDKKDAELLTQAKREMAKEVQNAGLNRESYANISLAMKSDPALRGRVQELIKQGS